MACCVEEGENDERFVVVFFSCCFGLRGVSIVVSVVAQESPGIDMPVA